MKSLVRFTLGVFFWSLSSLFATVFAEQNLDFQTDGLGGVTITVDGKFFAGYQTECLDTPILWPVISSNGTLMTRSLPMIHLVDVPGETVVERRNIYRNALAATATEVDDHPHHRSVWVTHGEINESDFWASKAHSNIGTVIHPTALLRLEKTAQGTVVFQTKNLWYDAKRDYEKLCEDIRTITFGVLSGDIRFIDYDIELTALAAPTIFGDTKEGTFGVRIPGPMDLDAKLRFPAWGGRILNSNGEVDNDAWGKRAAWVDYSGPAPKRLTDEELDQLGEPTPEKIELTTAGITMMNHPSSFRHPQWHHVRNYGLFAANPFGIHHFENKEEKSPVPLAQGEKLVLRYRLLFHDGVLSGDELNRRFNEYATTPR